MALQSIIKQLKPLAHPHYIVNLLLSVIFYMLKTISPICYTLFNDCMLEMREWELLTFLGCVIVLKKRKQNSFKVYFATICMFAKLLGVILFFRQSPLMAVVFSAFCILHLAFLPEPAYSGPDEVMYFGGNLQEVIENNRHVTWLVAFYAAWLPTCVNFASVFAPLSAKYSLINLKFGKVDTTRYPDLATQYNVNTSAWSKQLPTLVLFQNGKEVMRRPVVDSKQRVISKFIFSAYNIIQEFGLNELYERCKKTSVPKRGKGAAVNGVSAGGSSNKDKTE